MEPKPQPPLTLDALREHLEAFDVNDLLWGGFTRQRTREILETAIFFAEQHADLVEDARKYQKIRDSNRQAQKRWRQNHKPKRKRRAKSAKP